MTYIKQIEITDFGKFKNYQMEFDRGFNEFVFENEFGKSTITDFIIFMLYGFVKTASKKITLEQNYLKKYIPWNGDGKISGALELVSDGKVYRIERFQKETGRGEVTVRDIGGAEIPALPSPGAFFFGVDADTFLRTFTVRQTDMRFFSTDGIETALKNLVTTGDEEISFNDATEILRKKKAKFQHGDRRSGRIFDIPREIAELELSKNECKRQLFALSESTGLTESINSHLKQIQAKEQELEALYKTAKKADAYRNLSKLKDIDYDIEQCRQKLALSNVRITDEEINALYEVFDKKEMYAKKAEQSESEKESAKHTYVMAKATCPNYDFIKDNIEQIKNIVNTKSKINSWLVITGVLTMLAGAAVCLNSAIVGIVICLLGAIFTTLAFVFKTPAKVPSEFNMTYSELCIAYDIYTNNKGSIEVAKALLERAERSHLEDIQNLSECENQCSVNNIKTRQQLSELVSQKQNSDITKNQLRRLEIDRQAILGDKTIEGLQKESIGADPDAPTCSSVGEQLSQIQEQKRVLLSKLSALEKNSNLKNELEKSIYGYDKKIEALKQELEFDLYQNDVLDIATKALTEAYDKINSIYSPILSEKAKDALIAFSDGKYEKLYLDKNYDIRIQAGGETKDLGYFSKGTVDAVYFAVRYAVSELISGEKQLPILLDDPFWALDSGRLETAREYLKKLSQFKQIIIFSAR